MKKGLWLIITWVLAAGAYAQNSNNVTVVDTNFENGALGGWLPRGDPSGNSEKLEVVRDIHHSGSASMRVSNRSFTWHGPSHKLTDSPAGEEMYRLSAWIYFRDGPAAAVFTLSLEKSFKNPSTPHAYQNIASFQVKKGEWTEVGAEFSTGGEPAQAGIRVYFEMPYKEDSQISAHDKIDFWLDDIKIIKLDPALRPRAEADIPGLAEAWRRYFGIGAAVSLSDVFPSSQTALILKKHFSVLVAGNEQKMETVQPAEGTFNWEPADAIINFGEINGMRLRWHTLVWHLQNPPWLFRDRAAPSRPVSKNLLNQRLKTHIQTVMRRYRGRIDSYDVVNEALSDHSGLRTGAEGSKWHEILGPEYIDSAFRWAREADPDAQLVINDYGLESNIGKRQEMVSLVRGMKQRGVPVDAVGIQMHISIEYPPARQIQETIELFASLGVKVMVTELDISIYTSASEERKPVTDALLREQAQRYRDVFAVLREQAQKGNLAGMTVIWGVSDGDSWKNNHPVPGRTDAPLLFDTRLQSKPAFWALVEPDGVR